MKSVAVVLLVSAYILAMAFFVSKDFAGIVNPVNNAMTNDVESNFQVSVLNHTLNSTTISITDNNFNFFPTEYCLNGYCIPANNGVYRFPNVSGKLYAMNGSVKLEIFAVNFSN